MINYLEKVLPNLASASAPMRRLLVNGIEWVFERPQNDSFNELMKFVTESPVLKCCDPCPAKRVNSDASKDLVLSLNNFITRSGILLHILLDHCLHQKETIVSWKNNI